MGEKNNDTTEKQMAAQRNRRERREGDKSKKGANKEKINDFLCHYLRIMNK
jgi:hypothetical protein